MLCIYAIFYNLVARGDASVPALDALQVCTFTTLGAGIGAGVTVDGNVIGEICRARANSANEYLDELN